MAKPAPHIQRFLGNPAELRAAVEFTAADTGFTPNLIEKDFWCSVVLERLFSDEDCPLVFKGGTLLSKAYVPFNRLSEDLDFTLPTGATTSRGVRRRRARALEGRVSAAIEGLELEVKEWRSFNETTQHQVELSYPSVFGGRGLIRLEVALDTMTGIAKALSARLQGR